MHNDGNFNISWTSFTVQIAIYCAFFSLLLFSVNKITQVISQKSSITASQPSNILQNLVPHLSPKSIILFTLIMLLCWSPWVIGFYPGSMNWDTYYQIWQCYPESHPILQNPWGPTQSYIDSYFCDHHPIFDTLIFGFFAQTSDVLFGSWNFGIFSYALLQCLGTSASFVLITAYLHERNCPSYVCLLIYLAFCFFPFYPMFSATMLKDSLFSWLFIPWFIQLAELCRTHGAVLKQKHFFISFIILSVLLCLTKKTGYFVVLLSLVVFLIAYRTYWKRILSAGIACIVIMQFIMPVIVFSLLDVSPGGKQEILAPLFQQTARYVIDNPSEIQDWEREAIDAVLTYDTINKRYKWHTADPVKNGYNWENGDAHISNYLRAWASMGLRHPKSYLLATLGTSAPYFTTGKQINIHTYPIGPKTDEEPKVEQPAALDSIRSALTKLYKTLSSMPLIDFFFQVVLYTFWIPMFWFYISLRRNAPYSLLSCALLMSILACIATPIFDTRYALPLVYIAPFLFGLMFIPLEGDVTEAND